MNAVAVNGRERWLTIEEIRRGCSQRERFT
jgi:hypothetical protein